MEKKLSNTTSGESAENLSVITGGARSGKSLFAESLASRAELPVLYIATMQEIQSDPESVQRISAHRFRRPSTWKTVEAPYQAHAVINDLSDAPLTCIFDCLSLYVSNILLTEKENQSAIEVIECRVNEACNQLLGAIKAKPQVRFLLVTNEVGWGIVPENGLARLYRDLLGVANQAMAQAASAVWLSCSGVQVQLKSDCKIFKGVLTSTDRG